MSGRKVIWIMTDSQRTDMLGCYGNKEMKTPCIDKLAEDSLRFTKAYSCQPVCGPARSAMFTGLYPHSNGMVANSLALADNTKTIGQRLTDADIEAAYIGKYHLDGGDYFGLGRPAPGWNPDYWYDMRNYLLEKSPAERVKSRKAETMDQEQVPEDFPFAHHVTDRAIAYLEDKQDEDYFLVVSYDEPHDPYLCPEPYASMYKDYEFPKSPNIWDDLHDKPEHIKVWAGDAVHQDKDALRLTPAYFLGCNSYVDAEIGRFLDQVKAYAQDAFLIYTSDHGDALSSHSIYAKGPCMYDEIAKIPLLIHDPRNPQTYGKVSEGPASHIDLVPTVLEYFDQPIPKILEGRSMQPVLQNEEFVVNDCIFTEFTRYEVDHDGFGGFQPMRAVFDGRYKLSIHLLSGDELYDMENDPAEMVNLIADPAYTQIRDRLHDRILTWMNQTRDPYRGYYWERRPWRHDASPATWDYTGYTRQRENEEYEPRQMDYSTGLEMEAAVRAKAKLNAPS